MSLILVLKKFRRNLRDYGIALALKKSIYYLTSAVYEKRIYRIYTIDISSYTQPEFKDSEFTYSFINVTDTAIITQIESLEEWLTGEVTAKLAERGLCLVAMDKDIVAGFNLVAFGHVNIPLIGMNKRLRKDEAWSEQITVNPNYRRKYIGEQLRYRIFTELEKRKIRRFSGGTLSNNIANLKLTRKVGFRELLDIHYLKLLGIKNRKYVRLK